MKKQLKKQIKKYFLTVFCLLLLVTVFANSSYFVKPVRIFANKFTKISAHFILPKGEVKTTVKISTQPKTTVKSTQPTTANNTKTLLANTTEKGGRIISQTIDKSGANLSFGDVYVKNKTSKQIDINKALSNKPKLNIKLNSKNPQVLIVHTHATECFFPSTPQFYNKEWGERDNNTKNNMIAVGKVIKNALEKAGINTIQSETLHDKDTYTGAYDNSRETIKYYLKKYPSIKVVFDVHRDAINYENGDKLRPVIDINGKTAGQIMLISGCESGPITDYPNWQKNLRFSVGLQQAIEKTYPSLARPLFFAEKKYNQDLCENSCLIEVGSQANLISEAKYSAHLLSNVLVKYLTGKV